MFKSQLSIFQMFCFILTHWHLLEVEAHVELTFTANSPISVAKIFVPQKLAGGSLRPCLAFIIELKKKEILFFIHIFAY